MTEPIELEKTETLESLNNKTTEWAFQCMKFSDDEWQRHSGFATWIRENIKNRRINIGWLIDSKCDFETTMHEILYPIYLAERFGPDAEGG